MIDKINERLKELDIMLYETLQKIKITEVYKSEDLEKIYELYQLIIECYKNGNNINGLNKLEYTNLNDVIIILSVHGYLESKNNMKQEQVNNNYYVSEESENLFVEQKDPFNSNGPVYAFTNEALSQYMTNYDFENKDVLASLGSGDFVLNSYLLGASSVETFDINKFTYYFYQLKKVLILNYNYDEFCSLIKNPIKIFESFDNYKNLMDKLSREFFENLIKIYKDNYKELLNKFYIDKVGIEKNWWNESNTFDNFEEFFLVSQYKNLYFQNKDNYDKLRKSLKEHEKDNFNFVDLFSFNPTKKYDIVYLSNIGDYCKDGEEFLNFVDLMKEKFLNENGIIIVVSITNHIYMDSDDAQRTKMNWEPMEEFNKKNKGRAYLPISNLGIQNVYTTYPHTAKRQQY